MRPCRRPRRAGRGACPGPGPALAPKRHAPGTVADWTKSVPPSPWRAGSTSMAAPSSARNLSFFRGKLHLAPLRRVRTGPVRCRARRPRPLRRGRGAVRGLAAGVWPPAATPRAAGSAASASASSSESVLRAPSGSKRAATSRTGLVNTIAPFELALVPGEVGLGLGVEVDDRGDQRALGAGRPRLGKSDQGDALGLDDLGREPLERPAAPERAPRLEMGVLQAPAGQLVAGPSFARFIWATGQPRADHVGQVAQGRHDLRVLAPLP